MTPCRAESSQSPRLRLWQIDEACRRLRELATVGAEPRHEALLRLCFVVSVCRAFRAGLTRDLTREGSV
jgi:hypothetical protein